MNMKENNACILMEDLFKSYHTLLEHNGPKWIIKDNKPIAVHHVLFSIRKTSLKERLESDFSFSHHDITKDCRAFMKHAVKLAEAFQTVDERRRKKYQNGKLPSSGGAHSNSSGQIKGSSADQQQGNKKTKEENKNRPAYTPHIAEKAFITC